MSAGSSTAAGAATSFAAIPTCSSQRSASKHNGARWISAAGRCPDARSSLPGRWPSCRRCEICAAPGRGGARHRRRRAPVLCRSAARQCARRGDGPDDRRRRLHRLCDRAERHRRRQHPAPAESRPAREQSRSPDHPPRRAQSRPPPPPAAVGYPGVNAAGVSLFQNALSTPVWRGSAMRIISSSASSSNRRALPIA